MKFTLSWLRDHLDTQASLDDILYALTDLGLEVEDVVNPVAKLQGFTLAKVLHAEQHPDADKLRVCRVQTDEGEKQIVCGAPNARAGITVVLCKPGDYVPGIDVTLGVGRIRGVESHGMMASERELELSDEHDGIIELPSGEVGDSFADWLAKNRPGVVDPMIYIKVTPNRPDALGVRGIARDLAARGLGTLKPLKAAPVAGGFKSPISVTIDPVLKEKGCPYFAGRVIRGVKNGPSPRGCSKGCARSGCGRFRRWSISPTSSPSIRTGPCMCSMPTRCRAVCASIPPRAASRSWRWTTRPMLWPPG